MPEACPRFDGGLPPSPRQVLLGLFILFQLTFLIVSNFLGFAKWAPSQVSGRPAEVLNRLAPKFADERGPSWQWCEQLDTNLRRWVQLTGQDQDWALFAPTVGKATGFPAVLLSWQDPDDEGVAGALFAFDARNGFHCNAPWTMAPATLSLPAAGYIGLFAAQDFPTQATVAAACSSREQAPIPRVQLLLSDNEPQDIRNFIRFGKTRVRRYEGQLYLTTSAHEGETSIDAAERLNGRLRHLLLDYREPAVQYLRWRLKAWQSEQPDQPLPKQVILLQRSFRIHGPDEPHGWDEVAVLPLARWLPKRAPKGNAAALDMFNIATKRFEPMP